MQIMDSSSSVNHDQLLQNIVNFHPMDQSYEGYTNKEYFLFEINLITQTK